MFTEGNIIYFTPFYFSNGKTAPKNKYFLVLKNIENKSILASLPTSKDHVPSSHENQKGCIEIKEANFNAYVFDKNEEITENGWGFPRTTFIYGHQLDFHDNGIMNELYQIEGSDYEICGSLKAEIQLRIKECLKRSSSVKRKIKRLL